jgi:hypothetical protein
MSYIICYYNNISILFYESKVNKSLFIKQIVNCTINFAFNTADTFSLVVTGTTHAANGVDWPIRANEDIPDATK